MQGGDPLPLSRLDLQDGRLADRRARGHGLRREARQAVSEPHAGARRGDVRPGLRQPRHRGDAAGRAGRGPAPAPGALPDRIAHPVRARQRHPAGQLEGGRRQLHRGLPHPHRPPGPDADARLQALRRRGQRALPVVRRADARQALQQPPRAALRPARHADARPARARPDGVALRLHLSQHDDRPVPRPGGNLAAAAQRRGRDQRRVGVLSPGRSQPADPVRAVGQPAAQHAGPRRGHRPRRQRPAGSADARLPLRAPVGAREGRGLVRGPDPRRSGAGDERRARLAEQGLAEPGLAEPATEAAARG